MAEIQAAGGEPILFPSDALFQEDDGLFTRLRAAYDEGRRDDLDALWLVAEPFKVSTANQDTR